MASSATPLPPRLLPELLGLLPSDAILSEPEELRPYECDALTAYRTLPGLVLLPETEEQVAQILRLCTEHQVPVVARGAGTGLSGGALPHAGGVVLSLARFNRILAIDPDNRIARVQPGVRNLAISQATAAHGLYYAPDPSSQIACSIGGNVAENSGGVHCLKYGLTVHNVLGLVLLTVDGERLTLGGAALDAPGYDLLALLNWLGRYAGRDRRGHRQAPATTGASAGGAGSLRQRAARRGRRRCRHCCGHHSGRSGDDGPSGDPGRRGLRPCRLSG